MSSAALAGITGAFLCGSLCFGYWIPRLLRGIDIRRHGSGNPGATNVWRIVGRGAGAAVGVLDCAKGWLGVVVMERCAPETGAAGQVAAAIAAVAGHNWSPWIGFRGGKGILTTAGAFARIAWLPVGCAVAAFLGGLALSGYVSVGSLAAAVVLPCGVWLIPGPWQQPAVEAAATLLGAMAVFRHRSNIAGLLAGSELKAGRLRPRRRRR